MRAEVSVVYVKCYCSPGCNAHRWATETEAIESLLQYEVVED